MYIQNHERKWDKLHSYENLRLKYPSEQVIRFVKGNFKIPEKCKILDLGCGSGRHIICLLQEGYDVSGIDFSKECVDYTNALTKQYGMNTTVLQASALSLPFKNESFDAVIAHGVLLYLTSDDISIAIEEIHRVLRPGGKALVVVRAIGDRRYGKGEVIENNTYRMTDDTTNEEGLVIHFFDEDEIHKLFGKFSKIQIGFNKCSLSSLTDYDYDYMITVVK